MNRLQRIPVALFHVKPESGAAGRGEAEQSRRSKGMQHSSPRPRSSARWQSGEPAGRHSPAMRPRPRIASPVEGSSMTARDREQSLLCYGPHILVRITVLLLPKGPHCLPQAPGVGVAPQTPPASPPSAAPGAWGRGSRVLSYFSASRSSCGYQSSTPFHVKPLLLEGHPHARHDPHRW